MLKRAIWFVKGGEVALAPVKKSPLSVVAKSSRSELTSFLEAFFFFFPSFSSCFLCYGYMSEIVKGDIKRRLYSHKVTGIFICFRQCAF